MNPQQALNYLAQVAQDFANNQAPSVRGPFAAAAQQAVNIIQETFPKQEKDRPTVPSDGPRRDPAKSDKK